VGDPRKPSQPDKFEREVAAAKEQIEKATAEHLSIVAELKTTVEQLDAANERLRVLNEAYRRAQDELAETNAEVRRTNSDLTALLNVVNVPVVLVGTDLCIRRFTDAAASVLKLTSAELGKPVMDSYPEIHLPNAHQLVARVIATLEPYETKIEGSDGKKHILRISPYRDLGNEVCASLVLFDPTRSG
jgi:two-component system CheB/CheR fusion protein